MSASAQAFDQFQARLNTPPRPNDRLIKNIQNVQNSQSIGSVGAVEVRLMEASRCAQAYEDLA
jgi:hypothetical protein